MLFLPGARIAQLKESLRKLNLENSVLRSQLSEAEDQLDAKDETINILRKQLLKYINMSPKGHICLAWTKCKETMGWR